MHGCTHVWANKDTLVPAGDAAPALAGSVAAVAESRLCVDGIRLPLVRFLQVLFIFLCLENYQTEKEKEGEE